ncbi:unnamed protein product, partial [Polarella glacialis]
DGDVDICPDGMPYEFCALQPDSPGRSQHLRTPRLKQMASEGMIVTMLSGRDPVRYAGVDHFSRIYVASSVRGGFLRSEITTAEYLRDLGYTTGYAGKWHNSITNGEDPTYYAPWNQDFNEVYFWTGGSKGEPCHNGAQNQPGDDHTYHMCTFSSVIHRSGVVVEQPTRWENASSRAPVHVLDFIDRHAQDAAP